MREFQVVGGLGIEQEFRLLVGYLRKGLKEWSFFGVGFFLELVSMTMHMAVFYVLASIVGGSVAPKLAAYGGDYLSYLLLGIAFSSFALLGINTFYDTLCNAYYDGMLELVYLSRVGMKTFLLANSLFSYSKGSLTLVLDLVLAVVLFRARATLGGLLPAAAILSIMTFGVWGLGLIAASTLFLIEAKGWSNPVSWAVGIVQGLVCSVYYPPNILPQWLQTIASFFPQTYAFDAARRILLTPHSSMPTLQIHSYLRLCPVCADAIALTLLATFWLALGAATFMFALRKGERDGSLSAMV